MEYKAKIVLAPEVHKIINYLTNNLDTEIGAVGKVKIRQEEGEKYFYVYKLLFPQQKVTGATVHFTSAMWGSLIKEHGLEELKDVAWYWHRHPGDATHSSTDEEDTFEAFMDKDANRNFFIFYQTAVGSKGWNEEARIDFRKPVRATITTKDIQVEFEDPEEKKIEKMCKEIIEKAIVKEEIKTDFSTYQIASNFNKEPTLGDIIVIDNKEENYMDNDIINGYATEDKDKVSIKFENGQVTIKTGPTFKEILLKSLKKGGKLNPLVRRWKTSKEKGMEELHLQPGKKSFEPLKEGVTSLFETFVYKLKEQIKKDEDDIDEATDGIFNITNDPQLVTSLLRNLDENCKIEWKDNFTEGTVYDKEMETLIGQIERDKDNTDVTFLGDNLVTIVKANKEFKDEKTVRDVLRERQDEYIRSFYGY